MSTCRSCGEPVRWVKTSSGKNMPLDLTVGELKDALVRTAQANAELRAELGSTRTAAQQLSDGWTAQYLELEVERDSLRDELRELRGDYEELRKVIRQQDAWLEGYRSLLANNQQP